MLQGSLIVDLTIIASIPLDEISDLSYSDIGLSVLVNDFEATASVGSEAFSVELPIVGMPISFNMTDAKFLMSLLVKTHEPIDIIQLFSDNQASASASLEYVGTFFANLPMTVGVEDVNIRVALVIEEPNIFDPNPVVDHAIDLCEMSAAMLDMFDQLNVQIVALLETPFQEIAAVTMNIDKIINPLKTKIDNALAEISNGFNAAVSSADCARRLGIVGDTAQAATSLVKSIQDSLDSANDALKSVGIILSADVIPYFDKDTFSIGVGVELSASFDQMASDALQIFLEYVANSTDPSSDSSIAKLGLGDSSDAPLFNVEDLTSTMTLAAGLDITFGININLAEINKGIFDSSHALDEALYKGLGLFIDTWGAFGEIIVVPADIGVTLFGNEIRIHDSHFALAAELRSKGRFFASVNDMVVGGSAFDPSPLIPDFILPLSTELIFDIPVDDQITISPIILVESEDLVASGMVFDFDLEMDTFLNSDYMGENTVMSVLQNVTTFLQELASLKPEFYATDDIPSAVDGFFSVVTQIGDLSEELVMYIETVDKGAFEDMHIIFTFGQSLRYKC